MTIRFTGKVINNFLDFPIFLTILIFILSFFIFSFNPFLRIFTQKEADLDSPLLFHYYNPETLVTNCIKSDLSLGNFPSRDGSYAFFRGNPTCASSAHGMCIVPPEWHYHQYSSNVLLSWHDWDWNFGDLTPIIQHIQNPDHVFATSGTFLVNLKAYYTMGCNHETTFPVFVPTVAPKPVLLQIIVKQMPIKTCMYLMITAIFNVCANHRCSRYVALQEFGSQRLPGEMREGLICKFAKAVSSLTFNV